MQSKLKELNICTWNSRGLVASIPYLRLLCATYDVLCVTEHWLHHNRLHKLGDISKNFNYFGRSSMYSSSDMYGQSKGQGGVAILWNKNLTSVTPLYQIMHDRICAVRLQCENASIINIYCIYMPARGCADDLETTLDELSALIEGSELGSHNILCGDFNADVGLRGGSRSTKVPDKRGLALFNFITEYNLVSINLRAVTLGPVNTHFGPTGETCLDYVMIPDALLTTVTCCKTHEYHALNTSDHLPVSATLSLGDIPRGSVDYEQNSRLRWDKMSHEDLYNKYQAPMSIDLDVIYNKYRGQPLITEDIDNFMRDLIGVIKIHERVIPKPKFKCNIKPYWCQELNSLKKAKIVAYTNWISAGRPRDPKDALFQANKSAKKLFRKRLKVISREYDEKKISDAVKKAELDQTVFWKLLKRETAGCKAKTPSIKNKKGKVVHDVKEILEVWRGHFATLGTPIDSTNFDREHYDNVNSRINELTQSREIDDFSRKCVSDEEVLKGISLLNSNKAPGIDGVTKEHIKSAGPAIIRVISLLFNCIIRSEYIPQNFRMGIQVPLYKGKNASTVEVNNYRSITLLSVFNKLFELVLWKRMETWWFSTGVLTQLQGACRKGVSCVHTAYVLQESIATLLETNDKVFVTYLDVSKAFDGVWINGLFISLWDLGITGCTWRLLYNSYENFKCRVRIQDKLSDWYPLKCGIHQGGYLSLIKYIAFINSLLVSLQNSRLCCTIYGVSVSPLGYADDIATASTSKVKSDRVLQTVYDHSCKWRNKFNPKKSAVLVYGESQRENKCNSQHRYYRLGNDIIKESTNYDHLGLKNNCLRDNVERTKDKISKGRRALNAAAGLGLKPGGLSIRACGMIFWTMVVPIITFASELWVLNDEDVGLIEDFQIYAGRRIQRLHQKAPRETSYRGLGWLSLEIYIYIKKLLFIRTIAILNEDSVYKHIFMNRYMKYMNNRQISQENILESPTFDILRIAEIFGLIAEVDGMLNGTKYLSKPQWKNLVWTKAWDLENRDWNIRSRLFKTTKYINLTQDSVETLIWWQLGDQSHHIMKCCETMVKLVCRASRLKSDDFRYKNENNMSPYCDLCQNFAFENVEHLILQCPSLDNLRGIMLGQINDVERKYDVRVFSPLEITYY